MTGAGALFARTFTSGLELVASIELPELPMLENTFRGDACDSTGCIYAHGDTLFLICQYHVPAERAVAWAQTLLRNTCPTNVIILDSLFVGQREESAIEVKALCTDAARTTLPTQISFLPPPHVVTGPAAALLQQCQAHNVGGIALIALLHSDLVDKAVYEAFLKPFTTLLPATPTPAPIDVETVMRSVSTTANPLYI